MRPNSFVGATAPTSTAAPPPQSSASVQYASQKQLCRAPPPPQRHDLLLDGITTTSSAATSTPPLVLLPEAVPHLLQRNAPVDIQSPEQPDPYGFFAHALAHAQSRSPSASSLNAPNSHHCSPNPSPPLPLGATPKLPPPLPMPSGRSTVAPGSAASVAARMMSALLKQQNSIAEEEDSLLLAEEQQQQQYDPRTTATASAPNGTPPAFNAAADAGDKLQPLHWLLPPPPEHTLLGGNISPPPARIHPLDADLRREMMGVPPLSELGRGSWIGCGGPTGPAVIGVPKQRNTPNNSNNGGEQYNKPEPKLPRQQSQPTWIKGGASAKHRKGSLSPNNSLRYSTLMAAARRNHFQQQRTTSEATPAQRDQLMADVLGHGIRDKFCVSVSAPSPQLAQHGTEPSEAAPSSAGGSSSALRFELGGGDSSASSLSHALQMTPCSQCSSSATSLHRTGSVVRQQRRDAAANAQRGSGGGGQRSRTDTGDSSCCGGGGGGYNAGGATTSDSNSSIPRLLALVPPTFPPASAMLASSSSETVNRPPSAAQQQCNGAEDALRQRSLTQSRGALPPAASASSSIKRTSKPDVGSTATTTTTLCPPSPLAAAVLRRDPAKWNLAATKQRSSSESAFSLAKGCCCPACTEAAKLNGQQQRVDGGGAHDMTTAPMRATSLAIGNGTPPQGPRPNVDPGRTCSLQMRRPDSLSALAIPGRCSTIAYLTQNPHQREQALLQRILGPAGLGWLKQRDGLKKSFSLVLTDDVEAQQQRAGAVSALPGAGGVPNGGPGSEKGAQGSLLNDESNCSVKQPLVREKERGGRFVKRQQLFNRRRVTSDWALFFSLFGIVLMIIENEFAYEQHFALCTALKSVILLSTVCLVGLVVKFHVHEIQIFMNANSAEDWQIALTCRKTMQIIIEIIACAICPLPVKLDVYVTTVDSNGQLVPMRMPLDVLFSIMMFFRLYWLCRVMLLHSRLFTDAASRSIAGLNRVKTDAKFILKTLMTICPGTMLMLFTATLWMIGGYILRLCERQHDPSDPMLTVQAEKHQSYLNSLWLIAVTFLSIGYGDIVPNTQCGRIMAVVTGILGTCTSSMVVAVIARKLELTRAEKHVHNFMIETQHTKELKHIAANVLRETWLIYKNRRLVERIDPGRIRYHQRKFLVAICALRKLKTSQRKLDENRISLGDVAKTTSHSHELMREVHSTQEGLALRITAVEHQLSDIQRELGGLSELLRFAIRPATTTASIECSSGSVGLQLLAGSPLSGGSAQMAEQVRQRRKPSECSTGVELR